MTRAPEALSPRDAWRRYVDRRRPETTEGSIQTYHYRLKQFVEWCENQNIETVSELSGWDFETFETARRGADLAPTTLAGHMQTLKNFIEYLERIEAVEQGLAERVHVPDVDPDDESSDKLLETKDAMALLRYYRENEFGSRQHVVLELLWYTGARLGAIRGLDRRDYHRDERYIDFCHRPDSGTPLKNKGDGERPVSLPTEVCRALDSYLVGDRWDKRDEYGREPLITSRQGRPGHNSIRVWTYMATLPCLHGECPHGQDVDSCRFLDHSHASKCPSSRSPHQLRTGSITWQLDRGLPPEVVSKRVNASIEVIKKHYDKATAVQEMKQRRRPFIDRLSLEDGDE